MRIYDYLTQFRGHNTQLFYGKGKLSIVSRMALVAPNPKHQRYPYVRIPTDNGAHLEAYTQSP